ncbi:HAD family hydrolase [uncultured Amnibacterium sp.]|uniref:HAD family hydrolase n=1 Tax=uncultured Amnibacterium sp. TaxID=1631851 RepID=UPI0035C99058
MPGPTCTAVLLDIDGTLVDTNYLHVDAWLRACADVGHPVDAWRVHRAIGMDSAKLLDTLLGDDAERLGDEAKERHSAHYAADQERMRRFAGAQELLGTLAGRGFQVVLATSAPQEELDMIIRALDPGDSVFAITTAEDVETAKPAPDVVRVALDKAGVSADDAIMVGDAAWDAESSVRAGVRCIGVLSGGYGASELRDAGAVAVYDDVAALLAGLDDSPLYIR